MKRALTHLMLLVVAAVVLCSCSEKNSNGKIEYLPFQKEKDGWWGMISINGDVLFENQFKEEPSVGREGYFLVKNKDGFYQYYTTEEKPESDGKLYVSATPFTNGRALAVEPNKPVTIIDRKFNIVATLDKIDGQSISSVEPINGGYIIVNITKKGESLSGVVDCEGKTIIAPIYNILTNNGDGTFIGVRYKEYDEIWEGKAKAVVLDNNGNTITTMPALYTVGEGDVSGNGVFVDSLMIVNNSGEKYDYKPGIINKQGKFVVQPDEDIQSISELRYGMYAYYSGSDEGNGVKRVDGTVVLNAQHDDVSILAEDIFACGTAAEFENDDEDISEFDLSHFQYYLCKSNGERLGSGIFSSVMPFNKYEGEKTTIANKGENDYTIIDTEGKELEGLPKMYNVGHQEGSYMLESDYVDINGLLSELKITSSGFFGLTSSTTPKKAISVLDYWAKKADNVVGQKELYVYKRINNVSCNFNVYYQSEMATHNFKTVTVVDGYYWGYTYYHNETRDAGYKWNSPKMKAMVVYFDNDGNMHGKLETTKNAIAAKLKKLGTVEKDGKGILYVKMPNGTKAAVCMTSNRLILAYGNLKAAAKLSDYYFTNKEKPYNYENYNTSTEAVKSLFD